MNLIFTSVIKHNFILTLLGKNTQIICLKPSLPLLSDRGEILTTLPLASNFSTFLELDIKPLRFAFTRSFHLSAAWLVNFNAINVVKCFNIHSIILKNMR